MKNGKDSTTDKFIGSYTNFDSDYPFFEFYKIYDYYKKYGIYMTKNNKYSNNSKGKILWKRTMQKSNVILSDGNMIYLPLVTKLNNYEESFISECMIFVINYTIRNFHFFIKLRPIEQKENHYNFLSNKKLVIGKLQEEKRKIFKDKDIKLVNSLITFFECMDKMPKGGDIYMKLYSFENVWQSMVHKYLNNYYSYVSKNCDALMFDYSQKNDSQKFCFEKSFKIDDSPYSREIKIDHFYDDAISNSIYVFDSKYYSVNPQKLDYKQLVYTILIGNSKLYCYKHLYSALILPGKERSKMHLVLSSDFRQDNDGCNRIIEQYLDVNNVMRNYVDFSICDEKGLNYVVREDDYEEYIGYVAEDNELYELQ